MKDQFDEMGEKLWLAALSAQPHLSTKRKKLPTASQIIGEALRAAHEGKGPCEVCDRKEGSLLDRGHQPPSAMSLRDGGTGPLGAVTKCPDCGRWACPECLDGDCCSMEDSPRIGDEP